MMDNELLKPLSLKGTTPKAVEDQLRAFMEAYYAGTGINPYNNRERVWGEGGEVGIELEPRWGHIHISSIRTAPAEPERGREGSRGQGHASKALDWLCSLADKHQVTLDGHAKPFGGDDPADKKSRFTKQQLMTWYGRHGFQVKPNGDLLREPKGQDKFVLKLRKDSPMRVIPIERKEPEIG